jgi:magnesium chelatase subunit D
VTTHFTDRIAMSLSADIEDLSTEQRVEATYNVINFSGGVEERERSVYLEQERKAMEEDSNLRQKIALARSTLANVSISPDQILYICEEATRAGCDGQRGEIFATQIAKSCAAIDGRRQVNAQDLQTAVRLALVHRSKYVMSEEALHDEEAGSEDIKNDMVPIQPSAQDQGGADRGEAPDETPDKQAQDENNLENENLDLDQTDEDLISIPEEFMFGVNMIPIDPKLLMFMERVKKGSKGKRSKQYNLLRGR